MADRLTTVVIMVSMPLPLLLRMEILHTTENEG